MTEPRESWTRHRMQLEDQRDGLAWARERFLLPSGVLYFDGNSLGPLTQSSRERLASVLDQQWGTDLIASWNRHDWIAMPRRVGRRIAPLIGAAEDQVVVCDSVSVNLFKLLATALELRPDRRTLLCQVDHFPTDLYIAQGLTRLLGHEYKVRYAAVDDFETLLSSDPDRHDIAVVCLGHVDFRTGRLFDMEGLTSTIQQAGALALWDLSHSAGALPVSLDHCGVDLAVGCGYKFLNGGPGAPSFLYVARRHQEVAVNPLPGWLGHRDPFAFCRDYEPAPGIDRFICGTPPILAMASLDAALQLWQDVELGLLREKSRRLGEVFLSLVAELDPELGLQVLSPEDSGRRGSQISLSHEHAYAVMQALIEAGVVGDFRAPDILRFGICPLYQRYVDVWDAVETLQEVLTQKTFTDRRFSRKAKVT